MKRELTKIVGALVLLFALVILVWWHRTGVEKTDARKEKEQLVVALDPQAVDRFVYTLKGETIAFQRWKKEDRANLQDPLAKFAGEFSTVLDWKIAEPVQTLPDPTLIATLFDDLKSYKSSKVISEKGENPAEYGLNPPKAQIEFFGKGKTKPLFVLRMGDSNSAGTGTYVATSESPKILLAGMSLDYLKVRNLSGWRKKEVIAFKDPSKVKRITLESSKDGKKTQVTAVRDPQGKWTLMEPEKARADSVALDTFLNEMSSLRANDIPSGDAAKDAKKFGFDRPYATATFYSAGSKGEEKRELIVGQAKESPAGKDFPVRREDLPTVFMVSNYMKDKFTKSFQNWVAKDPFDVEATAITSVDVKQKNSTVELWKKDGIWQAAKPAGMNLDTMKVNALLRQIVGLKGKEYLGHAGTLKTATPSLRITVAAGEKKRDVEFFTDEKKEPEGRVTPSGIWYRFVRGDYGALVQKASDLAKTPPTPAPTGSPTVPDWINEGKGK